MVKGIYFVVGLFCLHINIIYSQLTYQKTYGGGSFDYAESIKATADGGFIVTGTTWTYGTGGASDPRDMYTVKANNLGQVVWANAGGITNNRQEGKNVITSADGGYLAVGRTYEMADGNDSWYIQKYDAAGNPVFDKVFGKYSATSPGAVIWDDELFRIHQHPFSPNILTMIGFTCNYRVANNKDITISQYNTTTNAIEPGRTKHIGSRTGTETGRDMIFETASLSYTIFGTGDSATSGNGTDFLIAKLAALTNDITPTNRVLGTTGFDDGWSFVKTADGGYAMVGQTDFTNGGTLTGNNILVIKVTSTLTLSWARLIGGNGNEGGFHIKETSVADGSGLIIIGSTTSFGAGNTDMFAVKLTSAGNLSWAKTYGGTGADEGRWIDIRADGSFLFAGACSEPIAPAGSLQDFYVVSASPLGFSGGCNEMNVTPTVQNITASVTSITGLSQGGAPLEVIAQPMTRTAALPTTTCKCTNYIPNKEITGPVQVCKNTSNSYYINKYPNINNYNWSITGGTFATPPGATDTMVNVNFTTTNVQIVVSANIAPATCTFALDTINITVDNIATAITTSDSLLCVGESTTLNVVTVLNQGAVTYQWNPVLPTPSASEVVTPGTTTTYTVTVTDSWICSATDTIRVTVFPYPVVNLGANDTVCNVSPVVLNAGNPGATYLWNNSTTASTLNATTSGTYWVDVTRNGCTTRDSIILGISTSPAVTITGDDSLCLGENTVLTANPTGGSGPYQYLWSGGLGTANNINVSPASNTTYTVTVTEAFGCTNTATQLVNVFAYPVVDLGPDVGVCDGGVTSVTLDAQNPGSMYDWSTLANTQTINVTVSGTYWVDVTLNGCTSRDTSVITFSSTPVAAVSGDMDICIGMSTWIYASATSGTAPYSFTWLPSAIQADSINLSPVITSNYSMITSDLAGCSDTVLFMLVVRPYPLVNLGSDTIGCTGQSITLNAPATTGTTQWSTGSSADNISVNTPGTFWVDITENNCTTRDTILVGFNPLPVVDLGPDTVVCSVQNLLLDATNTDASYLWSTGASTPTITINQTGIYWVDVTACGTTVSDSVALTVDTFSIFMVQVTPNECGQNNGSLTVSSTAAAPVIYQWTAGASGTNPALTGIGDGIYMINVTSGPGCTNTESFTVTCVQPQLIVTQLVTPNSDGRNDTWVIQGINNFPDAIVKVFNRWGNEVYFAAPYNNTWDGKSNSSISLGTGYLPAGTYYYTVDVYGDGTLVKSGYLEFQP